MKRNNPSDEPSTSQEVPAKRAVLKESNKTESIQILEQGKIYFTPIGGISVPRAESEGSLSLDEILSIIRPVKSIHFSFMIDFSYLIGCYPESIRSNPITLVVGQDDVPALRGQVTSHKNVIIMGAWLPIPFGTHHSKISILESEDGRIHVIVSTANMVPDDWEFKTQQFYYAYGEKKEKMEDVQRSPFQEDLEKYLEFYRQSMKEWKDLIELTDFSTVTDRLIFSAPGHHKGEAKDLLGHPRLKKILSETFPHDPQYVHTERTTFICQCSSIGSLGKTPIDWFRGQFLRSLEGANPPPKNKPAKLFLVFPSVENVRNSCQGYDGGTSVPYRDSVHVRQKWIQEWMCKWVADGKRRTAAVPHCKTYVKYDKGVPQWQLLTSANLSKAAWGEISTPQRTNTEQLMIRSFEIGVLITDPDRFNIPYDYPCVKYAASDEPFTTDKSHLELDAFGEEWRV